MNQPKSRTYLTKSGEIQTITLVEEGPWYFMVPWHKGLPDCPWTRWQLSDGYIARLPDACWVDHPSVGYTAPQEP